MQIIFCQIVMEVVDAKFRPVKRESAPLTLKTQRHRQRTDHRDQVNDHVGGECREETRDLNVKQR